MVVTRGSGSVVEHLLAKEKVAGSNPVFRSSEKLVASRETAACFERPFRAFGKCGHNVADVAISGCEIQ